MSKTKKNPLEAAFDNVDREENAEQRVEGRQKPKRDRSETVMIGGHFPKEYNKHLRIIAAEEGTTSQALLEEALKLLFAKKGRKIVLTE